MSVLITNNAASKLASSITSGATALSVTTGDGSKFPSPAGAQWFPVTLIKSSGSLEILRCTARTGDVLTVSRAQEGTAAQAFDAGDRVELRLTAAAIAELIQFDDAGATGQDLLESATPGDARTVLGLGTAATQNIQSSALDITNPVLTTGGFGVGSSSQPVWPNTSINNCSNARGGIYSTNASTTDLPSGFSTSSTMYFAIRLPASFQFTQILIDCVNPGNLAWRSSNGGSASAPTWSNWNTALADDDVGTFMKTLLPATTQAAAQTTLGLVPTASNVDNTNGRIPKNGDRHVLSAMVSFDGTGTVTTRTAYNVSSVTDNGTGDYSINFSTAMANSNYSPCVSSKAEGSGAGGLSQVAQQNTTLFRVVTTNTAPAATDFPRIDVHIFGGRT